MGWSTYTRLLTASHPNSETLSVAASAFTTYGPFSPKSAISLEHPGPPVIQRTTGEESEAGARERNKK